MSDVRCQIRANRGRTIFSVEQAKRSGMSTGAIDDGQAGLPRHRRVTHYSIKWIGWPLIVADQVVRSCGTPGKLYSTNDQHASPEQV